MTLDPTAAMLTPAPSSPPAALGRSGEPCPGCGMPLAADQRYCLNCGLRRGAARVDYAALLAPAARSGAAPATAPALGAAAPRTLSPLGAAAGLGLLLLAVLVGAVIGSDREPASAGAPIVLPAATTPPATTPVTAFTSDWPGDDGWTIQLQVLDQAGSTPQQVADAKAAATAAGAPAVGALDSSDYPSLPPDAYVVYSGVYASKKEAKAALASLKDAFPDAAVVEVSANADEASADAAGDDEAAKASDDALKELENASPEDYVKKSKKLPDTVGTEGAAPPVDQQAPGGGSDEVMTIE